MLVCSSYLTCFYTRHGLIYRYYTWQQALAEAPGQLLQQGEIQEPIDQKLNSTSSYTFYLSQILKMAYTFCICMYISKKKTLQLTFCFLIVCISVTLQLLWSFNEQTQRNSYWQVYYDVTVYIWESREIGPRSALVQEVVDIDRWASQEYPNHLWVSSLKEKSSSHPDLYCLKPHNLYLLDLDTC